MNEKAVIILPVLKLETRLVCLIVIGLSGVSDHNFDVLLLSFAAEA